jgi:hypothetical protein
MSNPRLESLVQFYSILDDLERTIGGAPDTRRLPRPHAVA